MLQQVGSNANLDRVGRLNGLDAFICRNPSQGGHISPVTMTATVEAILGAVYLDSGIDNVSQVMQTLGLVFPRAGGQIWQIVTCPPFPISSPRETIYQLT